MHAVVYNNYCETGNYFILTSRGEKLQLLNLRPTQPVEMQLVIEEIEERFNEDEISEIIEIVTKHLVVPDHDDNES